LATPRIELSCLPEKVGVKSRSACRPNSDLSKAEGALKPELEVGEVKAMAGVSPNTVASITSQLGGALHRLGRHDEAEPLLREAVEMLEAYSDGDDPQIAGAMGRLANLEYDRANYQAALASFEAERARQERLFPQGHPSVLSSMQGQARTLVALGRIRDALAVSQQAVDDAERMLGGDHPRLKGYDILKDKVVPGHEISITIVDVGPEADPRFNVGDRYIVQADMLEYGTAVGYAIWGGMIQYGVFDERVQKYLIKVEEDIGYSQASLVEPWACIEASYERADLQPTAGAVFDLAHDPVAVGLALAQSEEDVEHDGGHPKRRLDGMRHGRSILNYQKLVYPFLIYGPKDSGERRRLLAAGDSGGGATKRGHGTSPALVLGSWPAGRSSP